MPRLGPYFSAILYSRETETIDYYVLRQSMPGNPAPATLRQVLPNGDSLNLGGHGVPNADGFIELLKRIQNNGAPVFGVA
jgi:hypothetical protein